MFMCRNISAILVLLFSLFTAFNTHAYYGEECDDLSDQEIRDRELEAMCDFVDFWEGLLEEVIVTLDYTPMDYNDYTGGYSLSISDFGDFGGSFWGVPQADAEEKEREKKEREICEAKADKKLKECNLLYAEYNTANLDRCPNIIQRVQLTFLGLSFGYDMHIQDGACIADATARLNTGLARCEVTRASDQVDCL